MLLDVFFAFAAGFLVALTVERMLREHRDAQRGIADIETYLARAA